MVPTSVWLCCLRFRCGRPYGYVELLSFGGPSLVVRVSGSVYGLPLATDQVSHGGARMSACTRPCSMCCLQVVIVCGLSRSWGLELWGSLSCCSVELARSIDMGMMLYLSSLCS